MPHLPIYEDNLVDLARDRFKEVWDGFWDFALRDNVLEVAIGLMYVVPSIRALIFHTVCLKHLEENG